MTDNLPPDWAIQRATKEGKYDSVGSVERFKKGKLSTDVSGLICAFARYIEKHEKPPVDPDLLDVRQLLVAWSTSDEFIEWLLAGRYDDDDSFRRVLATYKQIKGERG